MHICFGCTNYSYVTKVVSPRTGKNHANTMHSQSMGCIGDHISASSFVFCFSGGRREGKMTSAYAISDLKKQMPSVDCTHFVQYYIETSQILKLCIYECV